MSKRTVEFEYDVGDKVNTPFTHGAIVTMLVCEAEDVKSYYVENAVQGISNRYFKASELTLVDL